MIETSLVYLATGAARRAIAGSLLVLASAIGSSVLTTSPALAGPNVLLIVSEDNGPELGCYGDRNARTPHLDRLAAEGVRFARAFVPYSVCSPSRAALLTGLYPHQNGQIGLATHRFAMYAEQTSNIVTRLAAAGYVTGIIGKLHVNPESAFPFDYRAISGSNFNRAIAGGDYVRAAEQFWDQAGERPWLLSVNFPDAHLPFVRQSDGLPAQPIGADDVTMLSWVGADPQPLRAQLADYYNCLSRLDSYVGRLLEALDARGLSDDTLAIYLGDHGAQFPRGKGSVYEPALHVPLLMRWPGQMRTSLVRDELVSTIDLLPTVLAAVGLPADPELPGRSLLPLAAGHVAGRWRDYIHSLTTGSCPPVCYVQHGIRDERYKLISSPRPGETNLDAGTYLDPAHSLYLPTGIAPSEQATAPEHVQAAWRRWSSPPRYELYDLEADPYEWHNLADDPRLAAVKQRLIGALERFQRQTGDPLSEPEQVAAYVAEQLAHIGTDYQRRADFRWTYLDTFPAWRHALQARPDDGPAAPAGVRSGVESDGPPAGRP